MTRLDLLKILIGQARSNGFDFKRWFTTCLRLPWDGQSTALAVVETQRRYYALLFHHDFARAFWKEGGTITFQMPARSFERRMADGSIRTIERKPFMRRSSRPGAWRYHLSKMALAEEPLRYMRKYLRVEEDLVDDERLEHAEPLIKNFVAAHPKPAASKPQPPPERPAQTTLALARKAAERRKKAVAILPSFPITPTSTKRRPRLPGSN
jgi:hypothetical protein